MRGLEGRHAIVAGGAGGIGAAICRRLVEEGMSVTCADVSERRGTEVANLLSFEGYRVEFKYLDAGSAESWRALVDDHIRLDVLVTAVYSARGGVIDDLSDDDWTANFRVTLDGVFFGMRACLSRMDRGGSIINIASVAGIVGMPVNTGYGAAKSAVAGLTRTVAVTLAPRGIRANSISPGFIKTRALDGLGELLAGVEGDAETARRKLVEDIPVRDFGDPSDIAAAVAFLASDDAAYITGTDLVVDGGYTAR